MARSSSAVERFIPSACHGGQRSATTSSVPADEGVGRRVVQFGRAGSPVSSGVIRLASSLPSSTPHWSKLLIPQTTPCTKTMCSYRAISWPSTAGVSVSARIVVLGRLPGKLRYGSAAFGPPEGERLGLGEQVRHQQVVVVAVRVVRVGEADEVDRDDPGALVQQLVERVLAVRARLAPHDRTGRRRHRRAVEPHRLAVRLHVELLQVGGEAAELLGVRQHRLRRVAEHVRVPDADHRRAAPARWPRAACPAKCSSTVRNPARNSWNASGPMSNISDSPIAESTE